MAGLCGDDCGCLCQDTDSVLVGCELRDLFYSRAGFGTLLVIPLYVRAFDTRSIQWVLPNIRAYYLASLFFKSFYGWGFDIESLDISSYEDLPPPLVESLRFSIHPHIR